MRNNSKINNHFKNLKKIKLCMHCSYNEHRLVEILSKFLTDFTDGRAIAQAVSRRPPTAAARVRTQVKSCGICG
jgi:hypothetical protein